MMKFVSTILATCLASTVAFAAPPSGGNDVTNTPDRYYLKANEAIDSLALLPPPPEVGSIAFLNDEANYDKGRLMRDTPRGKQAIPDANLWYDGVAIAFSDAFGMKITKKDTPEIYTLITHMVEDAGDLATRTAKDHYDRVRPYTFYKSDTCLTSDQKKLSVNGSYPSGHTAIGWAVALVLTEINPAKSTDILKRGYELGQSRVICGYHWQSDVDAGRVVGAAIVPILHTNAAFMDQLQKAKAEFKVKSAALQK